MICIDDRDTSENERQFFGWTNGTSLFLRISFSSCRCSVDLRLCPPDVFNWGAVVTDVRTIHQIYRHVIRQEERESHRSRRCYLHGNYFAPLGGNIFVDLLELAMPRV